MKKVFLLTLSLSAGCAAPPDGRPLIKPAYNFPPDGGHRGAWITFNNPSADPRNTVLFYEDGLFCKGIHRLYLPADYRAERITVPSNRPFTFTIDYSRTIKNCRKTYTFTPDESSYDISITSGSDGCEVTLEKMLVKIHGGTFQETVTGELIERENQTPFFQSGSWCTSLRRAEP